MGLGFHFGVCLKIGRFCVTSRECGQVVGVPSWDFLGIMSSQGLGVQWFKEGLPA